MNNNGEFGVYRPSTGMWYSDVDGLGWWSGGSPCDGVRERWEGPWGGQSGDQPFVDAHNRPGIFRNGTWWIPNVVGGGNFGIAGDIPVPMPNGIPGIYRPSDGSWCFDINKNYTWDAGDQCFGTFGSSAEQPVVTREGMIGTYRSSDGRWRFDLNGDRIWQSGTDVEFAGGWPGGQLVVRSSR